MAPRSIASIKDEARGLEFAEVDLGAGRMRATGVAIDTTPEPYRLDYTLATGDEYVTTELQVSARARVGGGLCTWSVTSTASGAPTGRGKAGSRRPIEKRKRKGTANANHGP